MCAAVQVRKELWQQQALAEAAAKPASNSSSRLLSPTRQASAAHSKLTSSSIARQCNHQQQQQQQQVGQPSKGTPARYAALSAAAAYVSPAAVHAAAAASKRLAKVLTLRAVLDGRADFATAYKGWEGSGFVVRLLLELQQKLWCKLAVLVGGETEHFVEIGESLCGLRQWRHGTAAAGAAGKAVMQAGYDSGIVSWLLEQQLWWKLVVQAGADGSQCSYEVWGCLDL
jgi:hypothetical protein